MFTIYCRCDSPIGSVNRLKLLTRLKHRGFEDLESVLALFVRIEREIWVKDPSLQIAMTERYLELNLELLLRLV